MADKQYQQEADMFACLKNGIIPNVIPVDGQNKYRLENDYEEANELDASVTEVSEIKKCLHAGMIPVAYEEAIEEMVVVEVKRTVPEETGDKVKNPYGMVDEMVFCAGKRYYVRRSKGRSGVLSRRRDPAQEMVSRKMVLSGMQTNRHVTDAAIVTIVSREKGSHVVKNWILAKTV